MKKVPFILPFFAQARALSVLSCALLAGAALWSAPLAHANNDENRNALASADTSGGYSGQVLAKVSRLWTPPPDTINRRVSLRLRIDGEGTLSQCELMTASDMSAMNKAACDAVREAGNFGVPPYGMPTEVYMTFWTGRPRKEMKESTGKVAPSSIPVVAPATTPTTSAPKAQAPAKEAPVKAPPAPKTPAKEAPAKELPVKETPKATPKPETVKKPEPVKGSGESKESKEKRESKGSRGGGLSGNADAATTPIRAAAPSSKAAPATAKPDTTKAAPAKAKPEAAKTSTAKTDAQKANTPKTDTTKPAGIRTQFAPYRDPKAKPEPQRPAAPSAAQQRYIHEVTANLQARITPPDKLTSSKHKVGIKLSVNGAGELGEAELTRSSGQPDLDEAVLRTLLRIDTIPPPPDKQAQDLNLTFTVHEL